MKSRARKDRRLSAASALLALALALLAARPAFADSALENWPGGNPFRHADNAPVDFPGEGPLSRAAGERARDSDQSITGLSQGSMDDVNSAALSGACSAGSCGAASQVAGTAHNGAVQITNRASTLLHKEYEARREIEQAVKAGTGRDYGADDVKQFSRVMSKETFPSDEKLNQLHPALRDAAYALRTSRANETYLTDSINRYGGVAGVTQKLGTKLEGNNRNLGSLSRDEKGLPAKDGPRGEGDAKSASGTSGSGGESGIAYGRGSTGAPGSPEAQSAPETKGTGEDKTAASEPPAGGAAQGGASDSGENLRLRDLVADLKFDVARGRAAASGPGATGGGGTTNAFDVLEQAMNEVAGAKPKASASPLEELGVLPKDDSRRDTAPGTAAAARRPASASGATNGFLLDDVDLFTRVHQRLEARTPGLQLKR